MSQYNTPEWFPFYAYAFLGDELVQAMTLEQVGAYTMLMISQWINGSIPGDIPSLARMLRGRTTAEMEILWAGLSPCFTDAGNGRLVQKRLAIEREKAIAKMAGNVRGGRASALARELKGKSKASAVEVPLDRPLCNVMSSLNTSKKEENSGDYLKQWGEFKQLYPAHRLDEEPAARAFVSREDEADAILAGLRSAVTSVDWAKDGGAYVPWASKFIFDGRYKVRLKQVDDVASSPYREV